MLKNRLAGLGLAIFLGLVAAWMPALAVSAQSSPLPRLDTKPTTVALFKNGLGFFIREGKVIPKDGWAVMTYLPSPTLGSFWMSSPDTALEEAVCFEEESETVMNAVSLQELLKANLGRRATLVSGDESITGTIKAVPEDRPAQADKPVGYGMQSSPVQSDPATLVVMDTENGEVAINRNNISRINFPDPTNPTFITREKAKRIKFRVASSGKPVRINLAYLQKGITWVPGYLLDIRDPAKARLTMQATVMNDAENLEGVDLFFVVGYPNFMYADIPSPLTLEQSVPQFLATLASGGGREPEYSPFSNALTQRVTPAVATGTSFPAAGFGEAGTGGLPGESEEDLFLYQRKSVSLAKGERACYPVFSAPVSCRHLYLWEVPDTMKVDARGNYHSGTDQEVAEQVWHSLKITNSSAWPWTTAPVLVVSGWKPVAQTTIDYTPKGADTNLKLTVATDIKTARQEEEIDRKRQVKLYSQSYDEVTVGGELRIVNRKAEAVTLEVKKQLTGELIEASHNPQTRKTAEGLNGVNPHVTITWTITLEPGQELTLNYKYKVLIAQ